MGNSYIPAPYIKRTAYPGAVPTTTFTSIFKDGFDSYVAGVNWTESKATGDIIVLDGNAAGASYLVISKSPLYENTETTLTSKFYCPIPIEYIGGIHMSQRTLGQEFAMELVDIGSPLTTYTDVDIASISQTTTTLTVTTATAHNLSPGASISIYGVNDSRFNYPSLVVATIPSPTQFTATAGPGGTIPSVSAGPFTTGHVTIRPRLGYASSGVSEIFENATVTNASIYIRADEGDAIPSGTVIGNQSNAVGTTASVQVVNTPYAYAFAPTTEYRFTILPERLQISDVAVDSTSQSTARLTKTQVIPSTAEQYKLRFRAKNNRGLTIPNAKIVSMTKSGTTTATVVTETNHGLTTADVIIIYGSSDQTNYANLTAATAVSSVINDTTFTVVIGTAVTSTVYGGFVARVQGGNLGSALGYSAIVPTAAVVSTAADGVKILTLTGSGTWTFLIGDYVDVYGLRSVPATGADLLCDGSFKVRNVATTTLELEALGSTVLPAEFTSTACGGGVIKRTDFRISFVRIFDFDRQRVELLARPASDAAAAAPIAVQNSLTVGTVSTVTTIASCAAVSTIGTNFNGDILVRNQVHSAWLTNCRNRIS